WLGSNARPKTLARLRETTGDPLLVRAGRGPVPTLRALELRERVSQLVQDAEVVLRPAEKLNLKQLVRTFTLRTREGFVENFGPDSLLGSARTVLACGSASCRNQTERARLFATGPSIWRLAWWGRRLVRRFVHTALFRDRFIGVVRMGHALSQGEITPSRYARGRHICVSRRRLDKGPIDEALKPFGLDREIVTIVGGFSTALALGRDSDLIASVP